MLGVENNLLRVGDLGLYFLSQREEGFLHHVVKEEQALEDYLVGLFQIVYPVGSRQLVHELLLLLNIELLLYIHVLLDEVTDLPTQLLVYTVLIG